MTWALLTAAVLLVVGMGVWWVTGAGDTAPGSDRKGAAQTTVSASAPASAPPASGDREASTRSVLDQDVQIRDTSSPMRIMALTYTARAGESRLVVANVMVDQPVQSSTQVTGVRLSLRCGRSPETTRETQSTENVLRGGRVSQAPRMVYTAPTGGQVSCSVAALLFPGEESGPASSTTLTAQPGSSLTVTSPLPAWSREWTWDYPSKQRYASSLIAPGSSWERAPAEIAQLPRGTTTVALQADHKVTVCYWAGGSSDVTTPLVATTAGSTPDKREDLCRADPFAPGAVVRVIARVERLAADGTPCAPAVTAIDEDYWVGGREHHARLNSDAVVVLPVGRACGTGISVRSWVENVPLDAGPSLDVMVHAPDERLAILPDS